MEKIEYVVWIRESTYRLGYWRVEYATSWDEVTKIKNASNGEVKWEVVQKETTV